MQKKSSDSRHTDIKSGWSRSYIKHFCVILFWLFCLDPLVLLLLKRLIILVFQSFYFEST